MTQPREKYAELLSLAQLFLLQEYSLSDRIFSEKDSYDYFRAFAAQRQEAARKAPQNLQQQIAKDTSKDASKTQPQREISTPPPPQTSGNIRIEPTPPRAKAEEKVAVSTDIEAPQQKIAQTKSKESVVSSDSEKPPVFSNRFTLSTPTPPSPVPIDDLKKLVIEHLPHVKILDNVPDDAIAREIATSWQNEKHIPQAAILSFNDTPSHQLFLKQLSLALEMMGISAAVIPVSKIDRYKGWDSFLSSPDLKIVIGSPIGISSISSLEKHYKETSKSGHSLLGSHPFFALSDIGFYMKEPALKQSLWKSLKDLIAKAAIPHE